MRASALVLLVLVAVPRPAAAWGFEAHKFVTEQAIALLPPELRTYFESRKAFVVERSVDPDLWRNAGFDEEPPNHFLDLDYQGYGAYPFEALPRDYDRAVEKFGRETVHQQGLLPWRTQEFYGKLQRAFASLATASPSPYALDDIAYFSAILSHYVGDGHVPLHAVVNYDGQLTKQQGVHGRWESALFERYRAELAIRPAAATPVTDPRPFMFEVLLASNRLADGVLEADKKAAAGREHYDDGYFEALKADQLPVLERRINDSITAVASLIVGAWEQAGRPALKLPPRGPRRVPKG